MGETLKWCFPSAFSFDPLLLLWQKLLAECKTVSSHHILHTLFLNVCTIFLILYITTCVQQGNLESVKRICIYVCVFLYLINNEYQNTQSTRKLRTVFFGSEDILAHPRNFKGLFKGYLVLRLGLEVGLG